MRFYMKGYYKIITFGCQMNVHESEKIAGILQSKGYEQTQDETCADVIVFNTCCIRQNAENTAKGNIGALKGLKRKNKKLIIAVGGCMTQQDGAGEDLLKRFPYVSFVFGTHNLSKFGEMFDECIERNNKGSKLFLTEELPIDESVPVYRDGKISAFVNIMYGCNNFCSYCIVPYVRGRERSREEKYILEDVENLVKDGYKEITLLGQNVNSYGNDIPDETCFASLLKKINQIEGEFRIRFMTSHPKDMSEDVIDVIANSSKICNNIHLPIQSGSNSVLQRMNRRYTREKYLSIIDYINKKIPNCGITTDIMVGFPGETDQDFEDTIDIVKKVRFQGAFTFVYSMRKGTKAYSMEQVDENVKKRRIVQLVDLQNDIVKQESEKLIGKSFRVLCEDVYPKKDGYCCGRTDSGRLVNFECPQNKIGTFCNVKITSTRASALIGKLEE